MTNQPNHTPAMDKAFNHMVMTMANLTAPCWTVSDDAPETFDELVKVSEQRGQIVVWNGESDNTIFGEPEFNWAFRAWHDSAHIRTGAGFTLDGEKMACEQQIEDMFQRYGKSERTERWAQMIRIEVIGQAVHFEQTGDFPDDQVAFMNDMLEMGAFV